MNIKSIEMGDDLCVIISGGDRPHIGCVTFSTPRPSLSVENAMSSTTSVLNRIGHKDEAVARYVSEELSARFNKHVAVVCGIHVDEITEDEIISVMECFHEVIAGIVNHDNDGSDK
ncbi:MAG TPA: hypothetical protein PKD52_03165 [Clostridiales bacterium]|nr:hypothetical protein [Clostridiales bacterium]